MHPSRNMQLGCFGKRVMVGRSPISDRAPFWVIFNVRRVGARRSRGMTELRRRCCREQDAPGLCKILEPEKQNRGEGSVTATCNSGFQAEQALLIHVAGMWQAGTAFVAFVGLACSDGPVKEKAAQGGRLSRYEWRNLNAGAGWPEAPRRPARPIPGWKAPARLRHTSAAGGSPAPSRFRVERSPGS